MTLAVFKTHMKEKLINLCGIRIIQKIFRYNKHQYTKEMWLVMSTLSRLKY